MTDDETPAVEEMDAPRVEDLLEDDEIRLGVVHPDGELLMAAEAVDITRPRVADYGTSRVIRFSVQVTTSNDRYWRPRNEDDDGDEADEDDGGEDMDDDGDEADDDSDKLTFTLGNPPSNDD